MSAAADALMALLTIQAAAVVRAEAGEVERVGELSRWRSPWCSWPRRGMKRRR